MSEPVGLSMSLDDLIKKRGEGGRGGGQAHRGRGRGGGGLGPRGGGVAKYTDRKAYAPKHGGEQYGRQLQQAPQQRGGGPGARHGGSTGQRRGGFSSGNAERHQNAGNKGAFTSVQTYYDHASGNVVVKLKDTEILTVSPDGQIVLSTGGWFTQTTLDVMNKALGALGIRVKAMGDVRDGKWQVAFGPHLLRFFDGIILHPKNQATASQRAHLVLAAMTGAPTVTPATGGAITGSYSTMGGMQLMQQMPTTMGLAVGNPLAVGNTLAASAAAASNAAAEAAGVMARARAALSLGALTALGGGVAAVTPAAQQQHQLLLAALAQQNALTTLAGLAGTAGTSDQTSNEDPDVIRRLKAQGRL